MIDHIGIKVSDLGKSKAFYKQVLAELGYDLRMDFGEAAGFGPADGKPCFWISQGKPAAGTHVCFHAAQRETVQAFHRAALAAGAKDNGPPGVRANYHPTYYGAFALDPDGYNIEAMTSAP
jgi:catechol 2,3-dioxygenase-like lactoylglutathione lyase family enzyme